MNHIFEEEKHLGWEKNRFFFRKKNPAHLGFFGFMNFFWVFLGFSFFYDFFRDFIEFFGRFFILNFLTYDSYFKSALKYSRSNLGNQQGDLQ